MFLPLFTVVSLVLSAAQPAEQVVLHPPMSPFVSAQFTPDPDSIVAVPALDSLASKATKSLCVNLDSSNIDVALPLLHSDSPDVKAMIDGITSVAVRHYTFANDSSYPTGEVTRYTTHLMAAHWRHLIEVHEARQGLDVYEHGTSGLVILVAKPGDFTLVSLNGAIDLKKMVPLVKELGL